MTPEAESGFLAALRRGAPVEAAAASAGVAVSTLYRRRKRDPLFDRAWTSAAELSSPWAWDPAAGHKIRAAGTKRRLRFGGRRRAAFLAALERDCNTDSAARETGVHRSTVRRHLARDPRFARMAREALERGYEGLGRELAADRAAMEARLRSGEPRWEIEPKGEITSDFDRQMLLLERYGRPDGTIGRRQVSRGRIRAMAFEEAIALLDRRLRWMGLGPAAPDEGAGGGAEEGGGP